MGSSSRRPKHSIVPSPRNGSLVGVVSLDQPAHVGDERPEVTTGEDHEQDDHDGRDHHVEAFTIWMAGGGIKQGVSWGETDEIGYYPINGKVSVHDVQATILNQLGILKLTNGP